MVKLYYGINGAFLTRRWEEPENFMKLTAECGYRYHSFCSDVLDPFFSGDGKYRAETAAEIKKASGKYGVKIVDYYTGVATHRFHGLSHTDARVRARMKQWMEQAMDLALSMGTGIIGGHWDALSVELMADGKRMAGAPGNVYRQFRELAETAKKKGMDAIYNEQMYIPSEIPWTLDGAEEFLVETNRDSKGAPVRLTVDIGHQAGQAYGQKGDDTDYVKWLERFAAFTEVVHVQQTTREASHHWPFTEEYNKKGHVDIQKTIDAIKKSFETCGKSRVAEHLKPVENVYLIAELIPGSTKNEEKLLEELKVSADYLKKYVPEDGMTI